MAVTALDHVYLETTHWESSVEFWHRLGFTVAERWGSAGHRAGRLVAGSAAIVLAEVDGDPEVTLFFRLDDPEALDAGAAVAVPLQPTHWGTRMIRVRDPEGRIHALEAAT
jgi:uncharacterized glyoxalase superfamily protein PhnB